MTTNKERFSISTEGFRELQAGRPPWSLVKELIQNSFDEAPEATECRVKIEAGPLANTNDSYWQTTTIMVSDDGPGFVNISDSYTLMAPTQKRGDPTRRGRFNSGEKEIISLARSATIMTVGYTVLFPPDGGREIVTNSRRRGTTVLLNMPWSETEAQEIITMLRRFRPTECALFVNDVEVPKRQPIEIAQAALPTVLQDGPGQPLRPTRRLTEIHILKPLATESWIYEMGIPIQTTDLGYDVDIMQKVDMPPHRNTVGKAYLNRVSAHVLNAVHARMEQEQFGETWIRNAIEHDDVTDEAVRRTVRQKYGNGVLFSSSDREANLRAAEAGDNVVSPRSLSEVERRKMREIAGVVTTYQKYGRPLFDPTPVDITANDRLIKFAEWVTSLANYADIKATVLFIENDEISYRAYCSGKSSGAEIAFNTAKLPPEWFEQRGAQQFKLVVHELAHALQNHPMEHGPSWGSACTEVAGRILSRFAPQNNELDRQTEEG